MQCARMDVSRHESVDKPLPPGQRALQEFPRFGIPEFARRPIRDRDIRLTISGLVRNEVVLTAAELSKLPRVTLTADFHCAAGWSHRNLAWSGFRFADVWTAFVQSRLPAGEGFVLLRCQDSFRTSIPLADLLVPDVLLVDQLNGQPLTLAHGAPVRLIAPAHYGYKNAKHLVRIELASSDRRYVSLLDRLLDHPRARIDYEERGQLLPGWLLRYAFRPFIRPLIRKIRDASPEEGG